MASQLRVLADAVARVQTMCQYASEPALTSAEVTAIVKWNQIASVWTPDTDFAAGDRICPDPPNGLMYKVSDPGTGVLGGTSGATAPARWPWRHNMRVQDGSVWWELVGPQPSSLWNLRAAACECWLSKAGLAASYHEVADDKMRAKRKEIFDNCNQMAGRYRSIRCA